MTRSRKRVEQAGYVEGPKDGSYFLRYYSEPDGTGKRTRHAVEVGSKGQFSSREEAHLSVEAAILRRQINAGVLGKTMGQLIALYERDALPMRLNTRNTAKAALYHCRAAWADEQIAVLADPTQSQRIQGWLNGLRSRPTKNCPARPLARTTKHTIMVMMGQLFSFAMQRGYIPSAISPMKFVRLAKGEDTPRRQTLTESQIWAFLDDPKIPEHVKVMAHVARLTGLRISEILGLKKDDFDLDKMTIQVRRRVFLRDVDSPKTKRSGEPIPLPEELYKILSVWMKSPRFNPTQQGWLFASYVTDRPWYATELRRSYLSPWGKEHDIAKFGWHTFRHTYKQFLEDSGVHPVVIQRLMRHSSYQVTDGYGSGVDFERLREGQKLAAENKDRPMLLKTKRRWA